MMRDHTREPMVRLLGRKLASFHRSLPREEQRLFEALLLIANDDGGETLAYAVR